VDRRREPHPRWPLPDRVAVYGTFDEFEATRRESGQWVFWRDRVDLVLQGRYDEVMPLHVELSPTYLCNFACPWCSCRSAREDWADEDVFSHPRATELTVMRDAKLDQVLGHLAAHRIGIMWVGGEPTMNPLLYPAALKACQLGLKQCVFTNGSLFSQERARALFDADLVFIRVSLNAVTPAVHQRHHDYDARRPYARRVLASLSTLAALRAERISGTMLGVSVVVDERNVADLEPTVRFLCELCDRHGNGAVDYVIFRPAFPIYTAQIEMADDTVSRFQEVLAVGSAARRALAGCGIDVVVPDTVDEPKADKRDDERLGCLSCGWFGEVTPNGDMVVCSDRYGNPDYFVGNVAAQSVDEIWAGAQRRRTLRMVADTACYSTYCPRNGRGYYLNSIFRQIEEFRAAGRIADVERWIADLRQVLPEPLHSFFL
jgi:MoaA/NifB/PqqE/SkfB family radical SAM enzyme